MSVTGCIQFSLSLVSGALCRAHSRLGVPSRDRHLLSEPYHSLVDISSPLRPPVATVERL